VSDRAAAARPLGLVCAGLVAAAALLWGGSVAVWYVVPLPGRPAIELTGAEVSAVPGGVALLALAGVAGVVAARGPLRRTVGLLLGAAGVGTVLIAVPALLTGRFAAGAAGLPRPPVGLPVDALSGQPADPTIAPLLSVAGAALLLAIGLFVLLGEPRLAYLGARYGAARRHTGGLDPDRVAWHELDAGRDPTVGRSFDRPTDPG
jgi:hypothetical protein